MTDPATLTSPGSDAAIAAGCTCPVIDNAHGRGVNGLYWIATDCPLHARAWHQAVDVRVSY